MTDTEAPAASATTAATPFAFDPENEVHARALVRLTNERIAWFGSTSRNGYPHSVPVWFLWHEGAVVILSEPGAVKVRNASRDPRVLVHLESGHDEEQLTVLQGTVEVLNDAATAWLPAIGDAYLEKYEHDLPPLKLTLEGMAAKYSTILRVTPEKLIAW
ncbi:PPOX class probable F420-dependent enzyme, Rv3369 family [Agromyces sp. CF514]|uniref:pyridoxamine 5'-phosphate oxidase family protein n=1 Tax=Agromyces sp. CF514 TaxID=1881031 RepID=UPI0008E73674|nr:pyridoxamine 5'-phosphate oxidase family protein [Agromyces sp. CF514]SFR83727.1 PPOX class probable F420-dependent enzyme, Rv3369 family [Agromyces sp. CF514]